jgi:hypothetical protein
MGVTPREKCTFSPSLTGGIENKAKARMTSKLSVYGSVCAPVGGLGEMMGRVCNWVH